MQEKGYSDFEQLHSWSVENTEAFWEETIRLLGINLKKTYSRLLDLEDGIANPRWMVGAEMNIVDSCFRAPSDSAAIVTRRHDGRMESVTIDELDRLSNRVANGFVALGFGKGFSVGVDMALTVEAIAVFLGIIKAGGRAIAIPDSLPAEEIARRLRIGNANICVTQDVIWRNSKWLPLYEKVCDAHAPITIVLTMLDSTQLTLRDGDVLWNSFIKNADTFASVACCAEDDITVLFSSGTTGDPKAIPWNHTTPIKCASDAMYHHDVSRGDVLCWPTSMGWMMGPWLVFASLINRATIAIYEGGPIERSFCEFVERAQVTMLGVVPSIVKGWRTTKHSEGFDWKRIRAFSSSGEASSAEDSSWLMCANQPAGVMKPIVEYCGGTEIGGGYLTNNLVTSQRPGEFNGKTMGIDFVVLNDRNEPCHENEAGEVFLVAPSMGLSTRILNSDNSQVYYANCPKWHEEPLRRHGDRIIVRGKNRWQSDGRADNTMNLGGIKIGSAEIERVVSQIEGLLECAAVGVPPIGGGPDRLVLYVGIERAVDNSALKSAAQNRIRDSLNPLFRVHDLVIVESLPRTASNKVLHRELREDYRRRESEPCSLPV